MYIICPLISLSKQDFENLAPFKKNFYEEVEDIASMTEDEVREYRKRCEITVDAWDVPKLVKSFCDAGFPSIINICLFIIIHFPAIPPPPKKEFLGAKLTPIHQRNDFMSNNLIRIPQRFCLTTKILSNNFLR